MSDMTKRTNEQIAETVAFDDDIMSEGFSCGEPYSSINRTHLKKIVLEALSTKDSQAERELSELKIKLGEVKLRVIEIKDSYWNKSPDITLMAKQIITLLDEILKENR